MSNLIWALAITLTVGAFFLWLVRSVSGDGQDAPNVQSGAPEGEISGLHLRAIEDEFKREES